MFANSARQFGSSIVQIALPGDIDAVDIDLGNVLSEKEAEVGVKMSPEAFGQKAAAVISATQATNILREMGILIPSYIRGGSTLDSELEAAPKMTPQQIEAFIERAVELSRGEK